MTNKKPIDQTIPYAAVEFIRAAPAYVGATITAHHLLVNRNATFEGGMQIASLLTNHCQRS